MDKVREINSPSTPWRPSSSGARDLMMREILGIRQYLWRSAPPSVRFDISSIERLLDEGHLSTDVVRLVANGAAVPPRKYVRIPSRFSRCDDDTEVQKILDLLTFGTVDPERVNELVADGNTLVINYLDELAPSIGQLCTELESAFGYRFRAFLYLTPANARGIPLHADDHDLLVWQVSGEKEWVFDSADSRLEPQVQEKPILTLREGDVMHLPEGVMHAPMALTVPSCHVTFGFRARRAAAAFEDAVLRATRRMLAERAALAAPVASLSPDDRAREWERLSQTLCEHLAALPHQELGASDAGREEDRRGRRSNLSAALVSSSESEIRPTSSKGENG